jgi:hypothetical protein
VLSFEAMDIVTKERTQNLGVIDTNVTQVAESSCGLWALRGYVTRAYDLPFSLNLFLPQDPLLLRGDGAVVFPPSPVRENPLEVPDLEFDLVQG